MKQNLPTTNIKGKEYVLVNDRIKAFRENFPQYSLTSEIVELTDKRVVMVAKIINPDGIIVATGHAYEDANGSFINKTSYIENCETSAWGRALANLGVGIDGSMCSADELANALINQQNQLQPPQEQPQQEVYINETQIKKLQNILRVFPKANRETTLNILLNEFGAKELTELPQGKYVLFLNRLVDSANVVIKKSLQGFVQNFASRAGKTEDEIRELLKTGLGKDIDEVELAEYPQYAKNAKQMAEDYKVENNEQADIQ